MVQTAVRRLQPAYMLSRSAASSRRQSRRFASVYALPRGAAQLTLRACCTARIQAGAGSVWYTA